MRKSVALIFGAVTVLTANAQVTDFVLQGQAGSGLLPGNEVPPATGSSASGAANGFIEFNPSDSGNGNQPTLRFDIDFSGLSGSVAGASIRGPADQTTGGASVLYDLAANFLNVTGPNSGSLQSPGSNPTPLTLTDNPNGTGYTIAQQETQLASGQWYIEVASSGFSMGEIRGNLVPVPEPSQYAALTGFALAGFAVIKRRRAN